MKKTKIWLVIASIIIVIGGALFVVGMSCLNWDFTKLSTQKTVTNTYEITQNFNSISIDTDTADIKFVVAYDEQARIVCTEQENLKHTVSVENSVLSIEISNDRQWYDYVNIGFSSQSITVYLPAKSYASLSIDSSTSDIEIPKDFAFENVEISVTTGNVDCKASVLNLLKIATSTGNINASGVSANTITLSASTGYVSLSSSSCKDLSISLSTGKTDLVDIRCENLSSSGSTGDLNLKNVVATQKFDLVRGTGDITFDGCDAGEIKATTSTGDISGTLLSEKVFVVDTSTGSRDYPHTTSGGICELTTTTGNVKISIK